ncbi:MAG: hypothetical protein H6Q33_4111 [Deltaproteobacteria bacterium]|nr:hypothetical protein [Deltaproteobacteria bacterium]
MRLVALAFLSMLAVVNPVVAEEEPDTPHRMLKPDGEADPEKCAVCHQEDMSLNQPKSELCTMCHSANIHAGAALHIQSSPEKLAQVVSPKKPGELDLPLNENNGIFCGTCHIFHDPRVSGEQARDERWLPPSTGLAEAVRKGLTAQWARVAGKYGESEPGAKFSTRGTRNLRLAINDGTLCRTCHGTLP